jgi:hypothetical protein
LSVTRRFQAIVKVTLERALVKSGDFGVVKMARFLRQMSDACRETDPWPLRISFSPPVDGSESATRASARAAKCGFCAFEFERGVLWRSAL